MHCSEHAHWMSTQSPEVAGDVITADLCLGNENWPWHWHKCEYDLCDQCIGANPGKKQVISEIPCETPLVEMSFNFLFPP